MSDSDAVSSVRRLPNVLATGILNRATTLRQSASELVTVPTVAMRNGDYSNLVNSAGILQVIYDPNTTQPGTLQRTPFPGNVIPISRESPLANRVTS